MSPMRLAFKNLSGHAFRNLGVFLSALLVAGFALGSSLILRGAERSLRQAVDRLGADILVVPEGAASAVESAILMGKAAQAWMPAETLERIAAVPGVAATSPQLYLANLPGSGCCSVDEFSLVAFDPATDFTLQPWLGGALPAEIGLGEAIAGADLAPSGGQQDINLYGVPVLIKSYLATTGTSLDRSLFVSFETAEQIASQLPNGSAGAASEMPDGSLSAILVSILPGQDPYGVSLEIMHSVPGVTPVENSRIFASYRRILRSLEGSLLILTGLSLGLSLALVVLVFTLAANERRREMGVLRALGANRGFVFRSLLLEAIFLGLAGGIAGAVLAVLTVYAFRGTLVRSIGLPFTLSSPAALLAQVAVGLGAVLVCITLASILPALKVSRMEPANAMRE